MAACHQVAMRLTHGSSAIGNTITLRSQFRAFDQNASRPKALAVTVSAGCRPAMFTPIGKPAAWAVTYCVLKPAITDLLRACIRIAPWRERWRACAARLGSADRSGFMIGLPGKTTLYFGR